MKTHMGRALASAIAYRRDEILGMMNERLERLIVHWQREMNRYIVTLGFGRDL